MSSSRKRKWTQKEALEKLKVHEKNFQLAAEDLCEELLPDGCHDKETSSEVEKLSKTIDRVRLKLIRLQNKDKQRRFRHCEDQLDDTFVCASQFSIFASQGSGNEEMVDADDSSEPFSSQDLFESLLQSTRAPKSTKRDRSQIQF